MLYTQYRIIFIVDGRPASFLWFDALCNLQKTKIDTSDKSTLFSCHFPLMDGHAPHGISTYQPSPNLGNLAPKKNESLYLTNLKLHNPTKPQYPSTYPKWLFGIWDAKKKLRSLPKCPNPKKNFHLPKFIIPLMEEILHQSRLGEVSISYNLQEFYTFQVVGLGISSISNSVVSWGNFPTSQGATEPLPTGHRHQGVQGFFLTSHASKAGCTRWNPMAQHETFGN